MRYICRFISWCIQQQKRLTNKDIEDQLWSVGVTNEFFDKNRVYYDLLDMIYNSVHSSLTGIPLQRTAVPEKNHNSWFLGLCTEDKMNINEVYLDNLKDDDMDQTSKVSTKEKSKSKNDILESNIELPCNNLNQTEPSNLSSYSEKKEIVGVHKTKDLMDKDDYKFQEKKGHNINLLK